MFNNSFQRETSFEKNIAPTSSILSKMNFGQTKISGNFAQENGDTLVVSVGLRFVSLGSPFGPTGHLPSMKIRSPDSGEIFMEQQESQNSG